MSSIKVETVPFAGAQDASIVISFPHNGASNYWATKSAECGKCFTNQKLDGGAVCAGLFMMIRSRVMYPAHVAAGTKITSLNCSVNNSHIIIAANCNNTGGKIKKLITEIVKCLNPHRAKADYAMLIKRLGIRPDADSFLHCAGLIAKGIDSKVSIGLYGKVGRLADEVIGRIEVAAEDKIPESEKSSKGQQRTEYGKEIDTCCIFEEIKFTNQVEAVIAQDYLMSIKAVFEHVHDSTISVEDEFMKSLKSADRESRYSRHAAKFMKSRTDDSVERLVYYATSRACFTVEEANTAAGKKLSASSIESIIKKAF
jgi:hypothetical protein